MTEEQSAEVQVMPFWKAYLIGFIVLVVVIAWLLFGMLVLKLHNAWVGLVVITMFGGVYHNNMPDAPKAWVGSLVGILLGYLNWWIPEQIGQWGVLVYLLVFIIPLLAGLIMQKLPLICNFPMFMMVTICNVLPAVVEAKQHLIYLQDWAYAAVCFWLIPVVILKLKAMKEAKG
ncbi:MAG: hypothetical protein JW950_11720 [Deltaproteobacteria bacterium]|nr:hypothetical protein [Deltaproteobacteria bacterium]